MKTLMIAALLGTVAAGGAAVAQVTSVPAVKSIKGDANADGRLTRVEFLQQAERRFAALDTNKDGSLTRDEARFARRHPGGRQARLGAMGQTIAPPPPAPGAMRGSGGGMARLDTNGDGRISRAEYDALSVQRFARMDGNGDGVVDTAEMAMLPDGGRMAGRFDGDGNHSLTRAEFTAQAAQRFARMDTNGDGSIDAAEMQAGSMNRGGRGGPRRGGATMPTPPAPTGA